jgi:hypothetical protein
VADLRELQARLIAERQRAPRGEEEREGEQLSSREHRGRE